jgi:hypothetical protein
MFFARFFGLCLLPLMMLLLLLLLPLDFLIDNNGFCALCICYRLLSFSNPFLRSLKLLYLYTILITFSIFDITLHSLIMPPLPTVLQLRSCKATNQDDLSMRFQIRLDEYSLEINHCVSSSKTKTNKRRMERKVLTNSSITMKTVTSHHDSLSLMPSIVSSPWWR